MSVRRRWTVAAADDFAGVVTDLRVQAPEYAPTFAGRVFDTLDAITMPEAASFVPGYERFGLREVFVDRYRVIYRVVREDTIELIAIAHSARLITDVLRTRTGRAADHGGS